MKRTLLLLALMLGTTSTHAVLAKPVSEKAAASAMVAAKRLFGRYVSLEQGFDGAVADLYADEAVIQNRRKYPDGQVKTMAIPAPKYKALIRAAMPAAKARGDRSTYSDVRYTAEGEAVRITATRFSELKKYASPISLLVKADGQGTWLIYEELSESQP